MHEGVGMDGSEKGGVDLAIEMMSVNQAATITTGWTGGGVSMNSMD